MTTSYVDTLRLVGRCDNADRVLEECRRRGIEISPNEAAALLSGEDVQLRTAIAEVRVEGRLVRTEFDCCFEFWE